MKHLRYEHTTVIINILQPASKGPNTCPEPRAKVGTVSGSNLTLNQANGRAQAAGHYVGLYHVKGKARLGLWFIVLAKVGRMTCKLSTHGQEYH